MVSTGIFGFVGLFPLFVMGGGDLLDQIPVEVYWQQRGVTVSHDAMVGFLSADTEQADVSTLIQKLGDTSFEVRSQAAAQLQALGQKAENALRKATESDDAEIRLRAGELLQKLESNTQQGRIDRLMAIRTLGEMKDKSALPALEKLVASQRLFEADYARRAIAQIKDDPIPAVKADSTLLKKHLWMLPKECGYVAQADLSRTPPTRIEDIFKIFSDAIGPDESNRMRQEMHEVLLEAVGQIGNMRLRTATIGVAEKVDSHNGFVVAILTGRYDKQTVEVLITEELGDADEESDSVRPSGIADVTIYQPQSDMAFIPVSNELFVAIAAPDDDQLPIEAVVHALKTGKGTLDQNTAMAELIRQADTTKPIWGASCLTDHLWKTIGMDRTLMPIGTIQDLHYSMDLGADKSRFKAVGRGSEPANVEASGAMVKAWARVGSGALKELPADEDIPPALQEKLNNITRFLDGIEYKAEDTTLTVTAAYEGNLLQDMATLPALWFMQFSREMKAAPAPPQPQQAVPVQPVPRQAVPAQP